MSQSSILRKQQEDLAEVAALLEDNKPLQTQIDRQIERIGRTLLVIEAKEQREAEEAVAKAKLADSEDATAKKIVEAVDHIAKDNAEKPQLKAVLESMSMADTKALDTFAYLKAKSLTVDQIKLVLGL